MPTGKPQEEVIQALGYRAPVKPASQASIICGLLSIVCAPSAFVVLNLFANRINNDLLVVWFTPVTGFFLGLSGIAYRRSSPAIAAWTGMILNLLVLGLFLLARTGFFGWQD